MRAPEQGISNAPAELPMPVVTKFVVTIVLIVAATTGGYLARRFRIVREQLAEVLMMLVAVFGYSSVGFLSVWNMPIEAADAWLPTLAAGHILLMAAAGLTLGRIVGRDKAEVGLFGMASAVGNNGFTMGGFIVYLLYGEAGLGLVGIYGLAWPLIVVLLLYPIARHFAAKSPPRSLGKLMLRSIFDWRSIGLPIICLAIVLSMLDVPRPVAIETYHVVDISMFTIMPVAYFSIGLRLHPSHVTSMKKLILSLAAMRFVLGAIIGLLLIAGTWFTPEPLVGTGRNVFIIEAFVPTAVTVAAVANMFRLKPRCASVLFVANTAMYLVLVLPLVLWVFG